MNDLFKYTSGPRDAPIVVVGEAWGREEARKQKPLVGASGIEFDRMLGEAGLSRSGILCTNLVHRRPENNEFEEFLYPQSDKGVKLNLGGLKAKPELIEGVRELYSLIEAVKPKLVIAIGNYPLWALAPECTTISSKLGYRTPAGIGKWRGSEIFSSTLKTKYNVLPIYHPAAILRQWEWRSITVHDLKRATRLLRDESYRWGPRKLNSIYSPSFQDVIDWLGWQFSFLERGRRRLAVDIETWKRKFVDVVGLADEASELCVPFFYLEEGRVINVWNEQQELVIWNWLKRLLEHPNTEIIGQNFIYDTQFFYRNYNIDALIKLDSMIMHHILWPGTPKRLEYLSSMYLQNYCYWKDESENWEDNELSAEERWRYNCKDTRATFDIAHVLEGALKKVKLYDLYLGRIEQWNLAREMMIEGVAFDNALRREYSKKMEAAAHELQTWLLDVMPENIKYTSTGGPWYNSVTFSATILYDQLGLPVQFNKKTKHRTLGYEAIVALRDKLPFWSPVLSRLELLRSIQVFRSHFLDIELSPDNRLRCSFNVAGPETFRWSSSENAFGEGTNLQNIPKVEEG